MKKQVENWILFADKNLQTAEIILKDEYPLTNIVAFHSQQVIEKYLKAFLIENNASIIKTHDLIKLNEMVNKIKQLAINEEKLLVINEVYIEARYPGDLGLIPDGIPSNEQAKDFLEFAKEVRAIILGELKNE